MYGDAILLVSWNGHWNMVIEKKDCIQVSNGGRIELDRHTATAVPGRKVRVRTAIVFMAALSCLVSSATCAVAAAISRFSKLSRLDSSAIRLLVSASCMFSLLSLWMMKFDI